MPGYEYYDINGKLSVEDSKSSCQPILYSVCQTGYQRDATGECVQTNKLDFCKSACINATSASASNSTIKAGTGQYDSALGMCVCSQIPAADMCDATCVKSTPTIAVLGSLLKVTDQVTGVTQTLELTGQLNRATCTNLDGCLLVPVVMTKSGQRAIYGAPSTVTKQTSIRVTGPATLFGAYKPHPASLMAHEEAFLSASMAAAPTSAAAARPRYHLQAASSSDATTQANSLAGYNNPTVCLIVEQGLMFEIPDSTNYPVYAKDNLLNSNPDFDYGAFSELADKLKLNTTKITTFSFTFKTVGTYIFVSSLDTKSITTLVVVGKTAACPSNNILPTSSSTLTTLGAKALAPVTNSLSLYVILVSVVTLLAFVVLLALTSRMKNMRRRILLDNTFANLAAKHDSESLEVLFNEINRSSQEQKSMIKAQTEQLSTLYEHVSSERSEVRALLAVKISSGKGALKASKQLLLGETTARSVYNMRQTKREAAVQESLENLVNALSARPASAAGLEPVAVKCADVITDALKFSLEEEQRRTHLLANGSIVGDDIMTIVDRNTAAETQAQSDLSITLRSISEPMQSSIAALFDIEREQALREQELAKLNNSTALRQSARLKFEMRTNSLLDNIEMQLMRAKAALPEMLKLLQDARNTVVHDGDESVALLNRKAAELDQELAAQQFAGLDGETVSAVKFFLGQSYLGPPRPLSEQHQQQQQQQQQQEQAINGQAPHDVDNAIENVVSSGLPTLLESAVEEKIFGLLTSEVKETDVSVGEELRTQWLELTQQQRDMERVSREEKAAAQEAAMAVAIGEPYEEMKEFAQLQVEQLANAENSVHTEEDRMINDAIDTLSDEEARIKAEIASLTKERDIKISRARNDAERADALHEFSVDSAKLMDRLSETVETTQRRMLSIHEQAKDKLRQRRAALKSKQQLEARSKLGQLSSQAAEGKIEIVDNAAIEAAMAAALQHSSAKMDAVARLHVQAQADLVAQGRREEERLLEQLARLSAEEQRAFETESQASVESRIQAHRQYLEAERESQQLEGEQLKELMTKHEADLQRYQKELEQQRARQWQHLEDRQQARKKAQLTALQSKQKVAAVQELQTQQSEQDEMRSELLRQKEIEIMATMLNAGNRRQAKQIIEQVMQPRHKIEKLRVLGDNYSETQHQLAAALVLALAEQEKRRADLARIQTSMPTSQYLAEATAIEEEFGADGVRARVRANMEQKSNERIAQCRRRQACDVQQAFGQFYPDEDFSEAHWVLDTLDGDELSRMAEEEMAKRQVEGEPGGSLTQSSLSVVEHLKAWDAAAAKEDASAAAAYNKSLVKQMHTRRASEQNMLTFNTTEGQRAAILDELTHDQVARSHSEEMELERQRQAFQNKLAAKRARNREAFKASLGRGAAPSHTPASSSSDVYVAAPLSHPGACESSSASMMLGAEMNAESRLRTLLADAAERFISAGQALAVAKQRKAAEALRRMFRNFEAHVRGRGGNPADEAVKFMPGFTGPFPGLGEGLQSDLFMDKLQVLETRLHSNLGDDADNDAAAPLDDIEKSLSRVGDSVIVAKQEQLTIEQNLALQHAKTLLILLCKQLSEPPIQLMAARSLPIVKQMIGRRQSAIENTLHYNSAIRAVYVRLERLLDPGSLVFSMAYVFAQIRANIFVENHPKFRSELARCVRVLCSDLFFQHEEGHIHKQGLAPVARSPGQVDQQGIIDEFDARNVVQDKQFREGEMQRRLEQYRLLVHGSKMAQNLSQLEGNLSRSLINDDNDRDGAKEGASSQIFDSHDEMQNHCDALNMKLLSVIHDIQKIRSDLDIAMHEKPVLVPICSHCSSKEATIFCADCDSKYFCSACSATLHRSAKKSLHHPTFVATSTQSDNVRLLKERLQKAIAAKV
jgi:hypothetical protein